MSLSSLVNEVFLVLDDLLPDKRVNGIDEVVKDRVVVYIHGVSPTFSGKRKVIANHQRVRDFQLLCFDYNPRNHVEQICDQLERFLKQHGDRQYYLFGHSLGGIVIRYFVEFMDGHNIIVRAALVATPHNGTYAAYFRFTKQSALQVVPGSELINKLNSRFNLPVPYLNVWAVGDQCIVPNESGVIYAPNVYNLCVKDRMHYGVLADPRVYRKIMRFFRAKDLKTYPTHKII